MILLARHGETDWNAPPARIMGSTDIPLNERGRDQARALAERVAGERPAAIWASPLARARETAEIVGRSLGLPVEIDAGLAESCRGTWEGRLAEDIAREEPEAWAAWLAAGDGFRFPSAPGREGEALAEHAARVAAALERVAAGPLPALVVCHGGTIRCAVALGSPRGLAAFHELEVANAELIRLDGAVPAPEGAR